MIVGCLFPRKWRTFSVESFAPLFRYLTFTNAVIAFCRAVNIASWNCSFLLISSSFSPYFTFFHIKMITEDDISLIHPSFPYFTSLSKWLKRSSLIMTYLDYFKLP